MRKLFAASLLFAGCATAHATVLEQRSDNTITGRAIMRTVADDGYTCAGRSVALIPDTASSRALVERTFANSKSGRRSAENQAVFAITNPLYRAATRKAACDSQGVFRFTNVPDGTYYVVGMIGHGVPEVTVMAGMTLYRRWNGDVLMQRVQVSGGIDKAIALLD